MRVKIVTDTDSSYFEDKINKFIGANKDSDIEIKYSTCTRTNGYVYYSAILIITPKQTKENLKIG